MEAFVKYDFRFKRFSKGFLKLKIVIKYVEQGVAFYGGIFR